MNPAHLLAACALSALIATPWGSTAAAERVEVVLHDSGDFHQADERDLQALTRYVEQRVAQILPQDRTIRVTIARIDWAGRHEWWQGTHAASTRFVRDVYTPRIDLDFQLSCACGAPSVAGHRELRDQTFASNAVTGRPDPLRYEKKLIDDWLEREVPHRAAAEAAGR